MVKHRKSVKGALLKGVLEGVPAESFEVIADAIQEIMHGKSGVYALYNDDDLYYVGLARSLRGRIQWHRKDRHAGKWNKFSIFIVEQVRYLKDIETMILHVARPQANKTKGRIPEHWALKKIIERTVTEKTKELKQLKRSIKQR
jgi:predicted GIY-YIG superfamily endonuclease